MKNVRVILEPKPSSCIGDVCEEARTAAIKLLSLVRFTFSGTECEVVPGMTAERIYREWRLRRGRQQRAKGEWFDTEGDL